MNKKKGRKRDKFILATFNHLKEKGGKIDLITLHRKTGISRNYIEENRKIRKLISDHNKKVEKERIKQVINAVELFQKEG